MDVFNNKVKIAEISRSRKLFNCFDLLVHMYHQNLRAAVNDIAKDSWNTKMRQRILNKIAYIAYGKTKERFEVWKFFCFVKLKIE